MGLILRTEADMLRELDTMCHADGLSLSNFVKIGYWTQMVGDNFDMDALNSSSRAMIRWLYKKLKPKSNGDSHVQNYGRHTS